LRVERCGAELSERSPLALREGTAGIEFIDENGGGPGVRLRERQRPKKR